MDEVTRKRYERANAWADARRRTFGDGSSRPSGPRWLGSKVAGSFVHDLDVLGWRVAVLFDEENAARIDAARELTGPTGLRP